jgi:hypothetical protein
MPVAVFGGHDAPLSRWTCFAGTSGSILPLRSEDSASKSVDTLHHVFGHDYKYRSLQKTYPEVHLAGLNMQSNPCGVSTATADISMFYDKPLATKLSL